MKQLFSALNVLILAVLLALISFGLSIRASRQHIRRVRQQEAWPAFVEALVSSVTAGLSTVEAAEVAIERSPESLKGGLEAFSRALQKRRLTDALPELRSSFENAHVDEFVQLLTLNERFGGSGLASVLKTHAKACRERNASAAQARSKNSATLTVAKLGVAAPWLLLAILLGRPESSISFETSEGVSVLLGGLAVSFAAYRLIVYLGQPGEEVRVYGAES